jgi:uncharacterized protein with PIN domain
LRADSGFSNRTVVAACQRHQVRFWITVKLTKAVRRAIQQLPADAWTPIPYWLEDGADVAETSYRPFGKGHADPADRAPRAAHPGQPAGPVHHP